MGTGNGVPPIACSVVEESDMIKRFRKKGLPGEAERCVLGAVSHSVWLERLAWERDGAGEAGGGQTEGSWRFIL